MTRYDPTLLDALESLPRKDWEGIAWRHMFNEYSPTQVNISGARWNPRDVSALYSALDRETALAEGQHAMDVQPRRIVRKRSLYEIRLSVHDLVDLTQPDGLKTVRLTNLDLRDDDFHRCQEVGGAAAWMGYGGILVPSARSNGNNLVVLVGELDIDDYIEVISQEVIFPV